jgi:hypothetical protein
LKERIRKENKNSNSQDNRDNNLPNNKEDSNKGGHNKTPIVHRKAASNVGRIVRLNNQEEISKYKEYIK